MASGNTPIPIDGARERLVSMMHASEVGLRNWQVLLRKYGIRPSKRLGQHFMLAPDALDKVLRAADLRGDETVLEIGAGVGSLTLCLAEAARRVIAVEIDPRLIPALSEAVGDHPRVVIVPGDILEQDFAALVGHGPYSVVANIPYNITSLLIRRLLEAPICPHRLVLTVQLEVAERIVARPGQMSLLALSVQLYGEPHIRSRIPARAFFPPPRVDSAVLRVDLHAEARLRAAQIPIFFRLARAGFQQKRKQLRNALSSGLMVPADEVLDLLEMAGIPARARAQELSLDDWARLVEAYAETTE